MQSTFCSLPGAALSSAIDISKKVVKRVAGGATST